MIALPPSLAGALKLIDAVVSPGEAPTPVGAPGTVRGVTNDPVELAPFPAALVANTTQVYCTPLVMLVTVIGVTLATLAVRVVWPAAEQDAVYWVMALPPLLAGAAKLTLADALPKFATTPVGAPGTVYGVTIAAAEIAPLPAALVALTVQAYVTPGTIELTVIAVNGAARSVAV
ncbi:MAG: hypothetical protein SF172_05200 [Burkholderiales bacterium]|nr:hypothetical protein [Burkholderiales bacterium]